MFNILIFVFWYKISIAASNNTEVKFFFLKYHLKILNKSEERTSHTTYLHLRIVLKLTK